jgi:hypothetical protein
MYVDPLPFTYPDAFLALKPLESTSINPDVTSASDVLSDSKLFDSLYGLRDVSTKFQLKLEVFVCLIKTHLGLNPR